MLLAYDFDILNYYDTIFWQFPFILGIGWYMYQDKFECISKLVGRYGLWFRIGSVLLLCFGVLQRLYNIMSISGITSVRFDGLLTVIVVLCVICVLRKCNILYTILMFLGKHSMNIYMVHTFLNVYWVVVRKWLHTIDTCRAYGINMWILLVSCLLISMMIDMVKEKCYWNNLTSKIIELIK